MGKIKVNNEKLKEILNSALKQFYEKEELLIACKGMEQACVFKIGLYINDLIKNDNELQYFDFDCEYNKSNHGVKTTPRFKKGTRPDLIIHERNLNPRNSNNNNIFVLEFKGWWNKANSRDIEKLEDFTNPCMGYHYQLGVLITLTKTYEELCPRYFKNGQEITEDEL